MKEKHFNKYITLLSLYAAQSIPMSFFSTVVPVIMRQENYSLESIGLLQLIKLPWLLKFLWAPVIDRTAGSIKQYKRWIVGSELFYAVIIMAVGLFDLQTDFKLIVALMLIALIASATQDIATDALAIFTLSKEQRSLGNSMQSVGSFLGTMVGSGVLLLIYNHFGWQALLAGLAVFVLMALLPLKWFHGEPAQSQKATQITRADLLLFFTRKGIARQIVFLVLCHSGLVGILAMLKPFLVDLGYDMAQIGFMSGIVGTATASLCALSAGFLVKRLGLNRCMPYFCAVICAVPLYFYWISRGHYDLLYIYTGICLLWGAYGMGTIMVFTSSMNCTRAGREGTDFTIQTVLTHFGGMIIAVNSGVVAAGFGYGNLFLAETGLALLSLFFVLLYRKNHPFFD